MERKFTMKNARKASGFTQKSLAERLGVSRNTVYYWESGRREITRAHFIAFCAVTGFSEDEIFLPEKSA